MDIIRKLPSHIAEYALLFLGPDDIDTVWNSMKEWKGIISNDNFWKKVCQRNGYQQSDLCLSSNIYNKFWLRYSLHWQAIYKYHRLIDSNWSFGNFRRITLAEEKRYDDINYFDDEVVVASVVDGTSNYKMDIINLSTGQIYFSLNERGVIKEAFKHQDLMIFSLNNIVQVWKFRATSWILYLEIEVPQLYVIGYHQIQISNNLLAIVNSIFYLRIFNLETKTFCFEDFNVVNVSFGDNVIIYLSANNELKVLDLDCKLLKSINYGEDIETEYVMVKGGYVIRFCQKSENLDFRKVFVYTLQRDTKTLQEICSIDVSYQWLSFLNDDTLLFWNSKESDHSYYYLWKFATENHTVSIPRTTKRLEFVVRHNSYMFIVKENSVLNMWCSKTGNFIRRIEDVSNKRFEVTKNKLAYLTSNGSLCIQNYDCVEEEN